MTPGTRFGAYEVAALIGVGGMGEVYRARDTRLGRDVALKLVTSTVVFQYAATLDGQRFLLVEPIAGAADADEPLYLLTNWQSLLEPQ